MKIFDILRKVRKDLTRYSPSVEVLINKENLLNNLREYQRQYPKLLFAPVLKSNAYGHGLVPIAKILEKEEIAFFVVDSLYEAIILRNKGIKLEILVIGYTRPENIKNIKLSNIAFTITSLEQLQEVAKTISSNIKIHLKIDTGMHRQGILSNQIGDAISVIKANKALCLEGICSHFADADGIDNNFTKFQIQQWEKVVSLFKQSFQTIKFFHISATAGTFYSEKIYENVARLGTGLYGINPSPLVKLNLKPVLQMQSVIGSVKNIQAGEYVGYNITYKAIEDIKVAKVPLGYFEGVDRRLSNCGFFRINNVYCPIVGRVSMNITSVDVTSVPNVKMGDTVEIISSQKDDKNSVENMAKVANTIPYEILIHIPQHLRRRVIEG